MKGNSTKGIVLDNDLLLYSPTRGSLCEFGEQMAITYVDIAVGDEHAERGQEKESDAKPRRNVRVAIMIARGRLEHLQCVFV